MAYYYLHGGMYFGTYILLCIILGYIQCVYLLTCLLYLHPWCIYRYRGEDDDRMSIASRKMTAYAKTDCIGASKGLFFGLITLVLGVISLILFFVLIDNENQQVSRFI